MQTPRLMLWGLGAILIIVAMVVLYYESGAEDYVAPGVAFAGLVLLVGLLVLAFAAQLRAPPYTPRRRLLIDDSRPTTVVRGTRMPEEAEVLTEDTTRSFTPPEPRDAAYTERTTRRTVRGRPARPARARSVERDDETIEHLHR